MNERRASGTAAASKARSGAVEVVGKPVEAVAPCCCPPDNHQAKLLPRIVVALLATSASAAESASGVGFFWAAVLVLTGPALGGLAVCMAMIGWRWTTSKAPWAIGQMAAWRWSNRARVFARADIASVLVPLIDHAGFRGRGTIQIVGSDGGYLTGAKKSGLTDAIRRWVGEGCNLRYILVAPNQAAVAELEALKEQIARDDETASGRFEVIQLGGEAPTAGASSTTPADVQALERILRTCHPTLIWSEDGERKAMWIEGNHPAGEDVSYNNQWVPPAAMNQPVADLPNQTWSDVFSAWDERLRRLCECPREQTAIQ